ncbi:hypothetical protein IWQ60_001463 [Tieghemiomyces parasiticus]|uniref:A to I editase domain-containing protein n=1 Tax=Tieghemiomyces parasiticus TaxID=78921 RepID=A0A9W8AL47_9FUNG|nr:hypothetical protein IWQ60_001463 [Tieghemiomyces parasiticus]
MTDAREQTSAIPVPQLKVFSEVANRVAHVCQERFHDLECVALGASRLSRCGDLVHDWHAEVIARRSFVCQSPCGDATMEVMAAATAESYAKMGPAQFSPTLLRGRHSSDGELDSAEPPSKRAKPSEGDAEQSTSTLPFRRGRDDVDCLTALRTKPVRLTSVVVGDWFSEVGLRRALIGRMGVYGQKRGSAGQTVYIPAEAGAAPVKNSLIEGQGAVYSHKAQSRLCKRALLTEFTTTLQRWADYLERRSESLSVDNPGAIQARVVRADLASVAAAGPYHRAKDLAHDYQRRKEVLRSTVCARWVQTPAWVDEFTGLANSGGRGG